jgi:hypothetical protein
MFGLRLALYPSVCSFCLCVIFWIKWWVFYAIIAYCEMKKFREWRDGIICFIVFRSNTLFLSSQLFLVKIILGYSKHIEFVLHNLWGNWSHDILSTLDFISWRQVVFGHSQTSWKQQDSEVLRIEFTRRRKHKRL